MDIYDIRLTNIRNIAANFNYQTEFAKQAGISPSQASKIMGNKTTERTNIGNELARRIEVNFGKTPGWLDQDHSSSADQFADNLVNECGQEIQRILRNMQQLAKHMAGADINTENTLKSLQRINKFLRKLNKQLSNSTE